MVGREYRFTKEIFPFFMELASLAIICKLRCEDGFDVVDVRSEDDPFGCQQRQLDRVAVGVMVPAAPQFVRLVLQQRNR